jgi:hypothetical protein
MTNVSKAMEYATAFEREAMREKLDKQPTKIFGPNLEGTLNAAGFYRKKEWVGLTDDEKAYSNTNYLGKSAEAWQGGVEWAEAKLKDKNT